MVVSSIAATWRSRLTEVDVTQIPRDSLATVLTEISVSVFAHDDSGGDASVSADKTAVAATCSAVVSISIAPSSAPSTDTLFD